MKVFYLGRKSKYLQPLGVYEVDYIKDGELIYLKGLRHPFQTGMFKGAPNHAVITPYRVVKPAAPAIPKPVVKLTLGEELLKKMNGRIGTCSFAIEFENGFRSLHNLEPCHAGLNYHNERGKPIRVFNALHGYANDNNRDKLIRFYTYVCNESPWKIAFEEPFIPDMINSGVYLKADTPKNILVGACIAMRQGSEFPHRLNTFIRLLALKYSPNVAFAASQLCGGAERLLAREGGGHDILHRRMLWDGLVSFFNENKFKEVGRPYNNKPGYGYRVWDSISPCENIYGKLDDKNIKGTVFGHVMSFFKPEELMEKKGWGEVIVERHPKVDGADASLVMANILAKEIK